MICRYTSHNRDNVGNSRHHPHDRSRNRYNGTVFHHSTSTSCIRCNDIHRIGYHNLHSCYYIFVDRVNNEGREQRNNQANKQPGCMWLVCRISRIEKEQKADMCFDTPKLWSAPPIHIYIHKTAFSNQGTKHDIYIYISS